MFDLILYAIPFFMALLVVEWLSFRHTGAHDHHGYAALDTATSLAMGIGNVVVNLGWKLAVVAAYAGLYELTPVRIPSAAVWAWMLLFFADDLAYYAFHRVSHEVRVFWASHVVHHSSQHYNLSTALRQTWVPMTGFPFWLPLALAGFKPWMIVLQQSISLTYQFFIHTERVGRLPRPVEAVLNTPSHHRVHHGSNHIYLDRNYGGILIVWDRLFGSFQGETEPVRYGLTKNLATHNPVRVAFHEYIAIWRDVRRAPGWRTTLGVFFRGPGWDPASAPDKRRPDQKPGGGTFSRGVRARLHRRGVFSLVLVGIAVAVAAALPAPATALPMLSHHGRWLTDPQGRVVVLHGVEFDKFKPGTTTEGWIDASPQAAPFIASQGFNLARVSIAFSLLEPQVGHYDDSYIQSFQSFDQQLASAGVYDLPTLMQGMYANQFDGDGFPDWMVQTNGAPNQPGPFPQSYLYDPAEERAWDNFWANSPAADGVGLQDHFGQGLAYLARHFAAQPGFLGFDVLNEPWAGSQYPSCANPAGCPVFDQTLNAFYRRIIPDLRAADPNHLVFYEPHALFDQGANTNLGPIGDPNAVFTFHNYCLGDQPGLPQADPGQDCGTEEQMVLGNAEAQASKGNDSLLEDEWGNTNSVPLLQRMANEADQHMVGWSYWAYEDCCGSPGAVVKDATQPATAPGNLDLPVLQALTRPYPQLVSGTPSSWSYDPAQNNFELKYSTIGVSGRPFPAESQTEVFIPQLQYAHGYRVTVSGATIASQPTAGRLVLCSSAGAANVTVNVSQDTASATDLPGEANQDPGCPASPAQAATSVTGSAVTVSGGSISAPGTARVTTPSPARCVRLRTLRLRLHLARRVRLLSVKARINGHTKKSVPTVAA